ncbi:MAG: hypothetical protein Q9198_000011 [Flavoplaca austrocitrina]
MSMQDGEIPHTSSTFRTKQDSKAYNLGWKLFACLQWDTASSILSTYESERRPVAQELLDFDQGYAQSWSNTCSPANAKPFHNLEDRHLANMVFTTGLLIHYSPNLVVGASTSCHPFGTRSSEVPSAGSGLITGMRIPNFTVLNQADATPTQICKLLKADGRFRLLLFPGDISTPKLFSRLQSLGSQLSSSSSFVRRLTPSDAAIDSRIEILTIHAAKRSQVELLELPEILHPWSENSGWDWWKVYVDDEDVHGNVSNAYHKCEIDPVTGCLAIVRPDGYVALVCGLEELDAVDAYFAGIFPVVH